MDEVKRHVDFRWLGCAVMEPRVLKHERVFPVQFINAKMTRCGLYSPAANVVYYQTRMMAYGRSPIARWSAITLLESDRAAFDALAKWRRDEARYAIGSSNFDEDIMGQFIAGLSG